jgi:ribosomal protein S27E
VVGVAGAKRNWIQEERRNTLGHWVVLCGVCGHSQRYFEESEGDVASVCPQCDAVLLSRCPACDARFASAFQVECEECGASLRPPDLFGGAIRRPGR